MDWGQGVGMLGTFLVMEVVVLVWATVWAEWVSPDLCGAWPAKGLGYSWFLLVFRETTSHRGQTSFTCCTFVLLNADMSALDGRNWPCGSGLASVMAIGGP